jgi:hypothetical protein
VRELILRVGGELLRAIRDAVEPRLHRRRRARRGVAHRFHPSLIHD